VYGTIVRSARVRESEVAEFPAFLAAKSSEAAPRQHIGRFGAGALEIHQAVAYLVPPAARLLDWPRTGDEDVHQSPGALLPVGTGGHVRDANQRAK
jgi:hypothetical protein